MNHLEPSPEPEPALESRPPLEPKPESRPTSEPTLGSSPPGPPGPQVGSRAALEPDEASGATETTPSLRASLDPTPTARAEPVPTAIADTPHPPSGVDPRGAAGAPPPFDPRQAWAANRLWMETANIKTRRWGGKGRHHWYALYAATRAFDWVLRAVGQHERGYRNACDLALRDLDHALPRVPRAFDGFSILHLSDLHLDGMPELVDIILDQLGDRRFDLCVLTGDYRTELHGPILPTMRALERLLRGVHTRHGTLAILGNHDDCHMVAPFEEMGVRMLLNESVSIERDGARIVLVGTDDVHYYYTDQALHALERAAGEPFSIALVHSPELYDTASRLGIDLYLCGHTHGGQVCLPGGIPVITHLSRGRRYFRGVWRHREMRGVTHCGTGTSGIPVRFNTRGEILVHHLRAPA